MLYNHLVGALAFSAPPSTMTRRDAIGAGALAAVVFPSAVFAEAATKPATKDGRNNNPETVEETMARLGLKPATSESIDNAYKVNNQNDIIPRRTANNPNPATKDKYGYGYK